jgi:hypothetical protein
MPIRRTGTIKCPFSKGRCSAQIVARSLELSNVGQRLGTARGAAQPTDVASPTVSGQVTEM